MEQLTEKALRDTEQAAREIGSVPKDKEGIAAALSRAFKDGFRIGSGMNAEEQKEPA